MPRWWLALILLPGCTAVPPVASVRAPVTAADVQASTTTDAANPQDTAQAHAQSIWLGIEDLPASMLGSDVGAAPFTWAVPTQGFQLDVHVVAPSSPPQDRPRLAGLPLTGTWTAAEDGAVFRAEMQLPAGPRTLTVAWADASSPPLGVEVVDRTAELDPFDAVDPWLVTRSRDGESLQVVPQADGTLQVLATPGADGVADVVAALQALGMQGGTAQWNAALQTLLWQRVRTWLWTFYHLDPQTGAQLPGSVRIQLFLEGDDLGGIDPQHLNRIALGGDAPEDQPSLFGLAHVDLRNAQVEDDAAPGYGIFTTSLVRAVLANPAGVALLQDVLPGSGQPFGSLPTDAKLLDAQLDPQTMPEGPERDRAALFALELRLLSLALASITAHEIGHSLGLIAPGLPPHGLLGGVPGPWVVTAQDQYHLDTPGPNLMQTGKSFNPAEILGQTPAFSALELGYLRRRLLVLP